MGNSQIKGYSWSFLDGLTNAVFTAISAIILARILMPEDFGLIGMLAVFISVSNGIINSGFFVALVRKNNATNEDYNTMFLFNVCISFFLYLGLYFISPFVSDFYAEPRLNLILKIVSLILIINAFSLVQLVQITKNIYYQKLFYCTLASSSISFLIALYLALNGFGVWALVFQQLAKQGVNTVMLWLISKWTPNLKFSTKSFKELFRFGSVLFLAGTLNNISKSSYQSIIGKFSNASSVGYYNKADQFSTIVSDNLGSIINRVSFPSLAKLQNDNYLFNGYYSKILKYNSLILSCALLFIFLTSQPIIIILIGEKWVASVGILKILCFNGIISAATNIAQTPTQIKGDTRLFLKVEIVRFIAVAILLLSIIRYSLYLALISIVIVNFIILLFYFKTNSKLIEVSFFTQIKNSLLFVFVNLPLLAFGLYCENIIQDLFLLLFVLTIIFVLYNFLTLKYILKINLRDLPLLNKK